MNDAGDENGREPGDRDDGNAFGRFVGVIGRSVVRCEEVFFALLLGTLLVVGLVPIVCRLLDLPGIAWSGPLSRQLVLWVALFGASAATRDRKHITIDAIGHVLPARARLALRAGTELFGAVVCGVLVPVSIAFVRDEALFTEGETAFLGLPKSWLPAVIPAGLSLLTVRFFLAALSDAMTSLVPPSKPGQA